MEYDDRADRTERLIVLALLLAYALAGVLFINGYLINADETSYISIAQKYLRGEFREAVAGYWSPLFSWLLVPFLALGLDPGWAAQILHHGTGLFLLGAAYVLARKILPRGALRVATIAILTPLILLAFAFLAITTDLLMTGFLLLYLRFALDPDLLRKRSVGMRAAVFGALAFLARHYAFFFVAAHLAVLCLFYVFTANGGPERKKTAVRFLFLLAAFLLLCSPWITAVSLKFKTFMISSSARLNFNLSNPRGQGHAYEYQGLLPPPNSTAVSMWEDPTHYPIPDWNPLQSRTHFRHWLSLVKKNTNDLALFFVKLSVLSWPLLLLSLVFAFRRPRRNLFFLLLMTIVVYTPGYLALYILERYVLLDLVLIVFLGSLLAGRLFRTRAFSRRSLRLAVLLLGAASFLSMPLSHLPKYLNHHRIYYIDYMKYTDVFIYKTSRALKRGYSLRGRVASNRPHFWHATQLLCSYLGLQYYGCTPKKGSLEKFHRQLAQYDIDYFFLWLEDEGDYPFLLAHPEITRGNIPELKIFDLKTIRPSR